MTKKKSIYWSSIFSTLYPHGGRAKKLSLASFIRALISTPNDFLKAPLLSNIILKVMVSTYKFEGSTNIQIIV